MPNLPERNDLSDVLAHLATKADLISMESRLIRWIAGSWIAMAGVMTAVVTVAVRFAH
jgi:hypothetical protein